MIDTLGAILVFMPVVLLLFWIVDVSSDGDNSSLIATFLFIGCIILGVAVLSGLFGKYYDLNYDKIAGQYVVSQYPELQNYTFKYYDSATNCESPNTLSWREGVVATKVPVNDSRDGLAIANQNPNRGESVTICFKNISMDVLIDRKLIAAGLL